MSAPRCTVTPLEALRRLIAEVKQLDAVEVGARWNQLQGELGVAEGVVRDYVDPKPAKISYDHPKFERYAFNMGCRDFDASDYSDGYANPHTQAKWDFWKASRDAIDVAPVAAPLPKAGSAAKQCVACEGSPAAGNNPCAICGASGSAAPAGEVERDAARYRWLRAHAGIKPTTAEIVVSDPLAWTDAAVDSMMKGGE